MGDTEHKMKSFRRNGWGKNKLAWEFGRTTITVLVNNDWASIEATVRADVMRKLIKQIMTRLGWVLLSNMK